ncbi:TM0106 family RecB-like putative nuclease [Yimella sp. RIT 621]|uniref:TM0106 family RecB-like putative nuclease n=1 Tax=Yimella sp. RIT 621 TaxID=2510323 RepID=UPI00101DA245|nr:TM0106 family RecB-like putative nuclease [Yimella sp. RIT 621]RYG76388.1 TM0106 family RecB-like putative nuclease [Yimella sp. RIT 621]
MTDNKAATKRSLVLGAYPAIQCPVRTHYDFDPSMVGAPIPISPELQDILDAGNAFEAELFDRITADAPERFHVVEPDTYYRDAVDQTLDAMERGVEIIVRGALPEDSEGHRSGRPDLLIRHGNSWPATYLPGDVKLHKFLSAMKSNSRNTYAVTVAPASNPQQRSSLADARPRPARLEPDALQLVHYTRMLETIGRHPGPDHYEAFLVSGDDWAMWGLEEVHGTWIALDQPAFTTYSRSEGTKTRSALERYDHEFGFRLAVAQNAATGNDSLVVPIYTSECDNCPWYAVCGPVFDADPTTSFTSWRPTLREWLALRTLGVHTVDQLAALELTPEWLESYQAETGDRTKNAGKRIALTIEKARIAVAGHALAFRTDVVLPPSADVEIDLDMENDTDNRVFLWGARLRRGDESSFHIFVEWDHLSDESELALANQLTDWLAQQRDSALANGETIRVFHHGPVERQRLTNIQGKSAVQDTGIEFVDTCAWAEKHLISAAGHGLKPLAVALGFAWRDDDPGGRNCQLWLDESRATTDPQLRQILRDRVLAYNEDDTAATAWIRDHASGLPTLASLETE